ncbi:hypothetical protein PYW07_013798 [Mythimna separata]|uniref:Uncharacterized protein n=1 Tax=Mythimna separata TaxID=271217 RepID=A0AAD7YF92_MYTSE|nr:hypothetical protein PYW07_013798 [Mythimna separata]
MNTLVVFFAVVAAACGSLVPLAQPAHHPALVLDPHGRPLDTAEVINARAVHLQAKALEGHYAPLAHAAVVPYASAVVAAPAAVSHQSRVDVINSPAVVSHSVVAAAPAYSAYASPLLAHSALGYAGHGHYLKKRSLGHLAYSAPVVAVAPSAVSHQSRVDVISSPAVVSHAVAPVVSHAYAAPVVAVAPAAVSHQSRVDVRTSPAVVSHSVAPVYAAASYAAPAYGYAAGAYASPAYGYSTYGAHAGLALSHGHLLKKRSLAHYAAVPVVHAVPSAVSHQSRVDVISKPAVVSTYAHAAPAVYAAPAAVYAAPAVSHFAPIAHSAVWSAPHHLRAALW